MNVIKPHAIPMHIVITPKDYLIVLATMDTKGMDLSVMVRFTVDVGDSLLISIYRRY